MIFIILLFASVFSLAVHPAFHPAVHESHEVHIEDHEVHVTRHPANNGKQNATKTIKDEPKEDKQFSVLCIIFFIIIGFIGVGCISLITLYVMILITNEENTRNYNNEELIRLL